MFAKIGYYLNLSREARKCQNIYSVWTGFKRARISIYISVANEAQEHAYYYYISPVSCACEACEERKNKGGIRISSVFVAPYVRRWGAVLVRQGQRYPLMRRTGSHKAWVVCVSERLCRLSSFLWAISCKIFKFKCVIGTYIAKNIQIFICIWFFVLPSIFLLLIRFL